jgi:hypothetical protein
VQVTTRAIETGCVMELSTLAWEHGTITTAENMTGVVHITDPAFGITDNTRKDIRRGTETDTETATETATIAADSGIIGFLGVGFKACSAGCQPA